MKKFFALGAICAVLLGADAIAARVSGGATGGASRGRAPAASVSKSTNTTQQQPALGATSARAAVNRGAGGGVRQGGAQNAQSVLPTQKGGATTAAGAPKSGISARAAKTQKAINTGVKVTAANENIVVSDECKTKYYGCMDSFCMLDNTNGGRCLCSNRHEELETVLADIQKLDEQSYAMATSGVERINMGDDADAVNAMVNKATSEIEDPDGNKKKARKTLNLDAWNDISIDDEEMFVDDSNDITNLKGDALHASVSQVCIKQIPECADKMSMLKMMYTQQIKADCNAYENSLKKQKNESAKKLQTAQQAMREAALEQHQNANKFDLGQCTVRFKQCMQTTAGCGEDFSKCASVVGAEQAQTKVGGRKKSKDYKIQGAATSITIAATTYDTLIAKKPMCESVTKQCVAVKDKVWDTFLHEVAPELKSAELIAESNLRMNCIGNISECFQKACKDNMDPNDPDGSYDMCLSRPETMRSLCKVQIDPCEAAEPQIMDYVYARLASMRVDACTTEVKECLTSEDRCGKDYAKCIGLDLEGIQSMCPFEKLVGCQKSGETQAWDAIQSIVQSIYLDADNQLLTACQNAVNSKRLEVCGDEAQCAAFDDDKSMGADSLMSYKQSDGSYVIEGLVSFGNVKVKKIDDPDGDPDDIKFGVYELDINGYAEELANNNPSTAVRDRILSTLQSTQNKINQIIALLTSDPKISMCIYGRDMKQITKSPNNTTARYPHLLDSTIMDVINAGLDKADANYHKKLEELIAKANEDASDEKKAAICAAMASDSAGEITDLFTGNSTSSGAGATGNGYDVKLVIDGVKYNDILAVSTMGKGQYIQTDKEGNMISQMIMRSSYSPDTNTCTLTTTTTVCEGMEAVYDTGNSSSCGSGGFTLFGGKGCSGGGGGLFSVGGGGKTTSSYSTYRGSICKKMGEPITKTEDIRL